MAVKNITKKAKKAAGFLTEDEFFARLVEACGYMDPDTVQRAYNGLIRLIFSELTTRGGVSLPQLADIFLSQAKARTIRNHNMAHAKTIPAHHQVRMVPKRTMKAFFKAFDEMSPGRIVDPATRAALATNNSGIVGESRQWPPTTQR